MLELEKQLVLSVDEDGDVGFDVLWVENLYEALPQYSNEDIFYALFNLDQAGFIQTATLDGNDTAQLCGVLYMTYDGHTFLDQIRDNTRWRRILEAAGKALGSYSLGAINQIANGVMTALIDTAIHSLIR